MLRNLLNAKQQEAIAHLTSLIQNHQFGAAIGFVVESMNLIDFLSEYLEVLDVGC